MAEHCHKHPTVDAVSRCTHCSTPICQECLYYHDGAVFCGHACASARRKMGSDLHAELKRKSGGSFFGSLLRYAIIAAIILGLLEYFHVTNFTGLF